MLEAYGSGNDKHCIFVLKYHMHEGLSLNAIQKRFLYSPSILPKVSRSNIESRQESIPSLLNRLLPRLTYPPPPPPLINLLFLLSSSLLIHQPQTPCPPMCTQPRPPQPLHRPIFEEAEVHAEGLVLERSASGD